MADLVTTGSTIEIPAGSIVNTIYRREYWLEEYYVEILKSQGPKYREFVLSDLFYSYNETTGIITLQRDFGDIRVSYTPPLDTEALKRIVPITKANTAAKNNRFYDTNRTYILESQQQNKISNEGTVVGNFNETNGVKSLTAFAKEGELITKRIMPVKLTGAAGDGRLLVSTTNASELTSIFGVAPAATGTLKKIVTSGAPQSIFKQMEKSFSGLSPQRIRTYAANISANPSLTINSLKPENNPSTVSVQTASQIYKEKLKLKLNNGGFNLDPFGAFSGLARSKQNLAGQFIGTLLNKVGSVFGSILNGLKVFDNPSPSITSAFGGNVKDLIEQGGAQTNLSSYMSKGNTVSVSAPTISYVLQNQNAFLGYATPASYEFTFVNSTEELISEFSSSRRGPNSTEEDAIGGLFVYETTKFTGPPEKANARAMNEGVKKVQLKILTKEIQETNTAADDKTAAETALDRISNRPNDYGLNSHYLILTDGSLQRGRPIDKPRTPSAYPRFYKTGLQLTFVSGGKKPNAKMFETYDRFLKAWFAVFPDCGVYATSEVGRDVQNTFDVRQSVKSKFRFVYRYDDLSELDEFPTKVERAITRPSKIATTSSTINKPIPLSEANQNINDLLESNRINNDANSLMKKAGGALALLNGESRNAAAAKFGAENLPKNDVKAQFDKDYKTFQAGMKQRNKEINNIVNKLNTNNTTVKTFGNELNKNRST